MSDWMKDAVDVTHEYEQSLAENTPETSLSKVALQGATAGFMDELAGLGEAAGRVIGVEGAGSKPVLDMSLSKDGPTLDWETLKAAYQMARDKERGIVQKTREESPTASLVTDIAGSFLMPGTQALAAAKGAKAVGAGIATGAAMGAGTSEAEDLGEFGKDVALGGAIGGAIPIALGGAGKTAKLVGVDKWKPVQAFKKGLEGVKLNSEELYQELVDQGKKILGLSQEEAKKLAKKKTAEILAKGEGTFVDLNKARQELEEDLSQVASGGSKESKAVVEDISSGLSSEFGDTETKEQVIKRFKEVPGKPSSKEELQKQLETELEDRARFGGDVRGEITESESGSHLYGDIYEKSPVSGEKFIPEKITPEKIIPAKTGFMTQQEALAEAKAGRLSKEQMLAFEQTDGKKVPKIIREEKVIPAKIQEQELITAPTYEDKRVWSKRVENIPEVPSSIEPEMEEIITKFRNDKPLSLKEAEKLRKWSTQKLGEAGTKSDDTIYDAVYRFRGKVSESINLSDPQIKKLNDQINTINEAMEDIKIGNDFGKKGEKYAEKLSSEERVSGLISKASEGGLSGKFAKDRIENALNKIEEISPELASSFKRDINSLTERLGIVGSSGEGELSKLSNRGIAMKIAESVANPAGLALSKVAKPISTAAKYGTAVAPTVFQARTASDISSAKPGEQSRALSDSNDSKLLKVADRLSPNARYTEVADLLKKAINEGNIDMKNKLIFKLMQDKNARELIRNMNSGE